MRDYGFDHPAAVIRFVHTLDALYVWQRKGRGVRATRCFNAAVAGRPGRPSGERRQLALCARSQCRSAQETDTIRSQVPSRVRALSSSFSLACRFGIDVLVCIARWDGSHGYDVVTRVPEEREQGALGRLIHLADYLSGVGGRPRRDGQCAEPAPYQAQYGA
jgi:hypothetical protein